MTSAQTSLTVVVANPAGDYVYDLVVDLLWQHGTIAIYEQHDESSCTLTAAFPTEEGLRQAMEAVAAHGRVSLAHESADAWVESWQEHAQPTVVGNIGIGLSSHAPLDCSHWLTINPGVAFGHGAHPTTAMLLALLQQHPPVGGRVADIGTGTGVLAIAAATLGATHVDAVDVDPNAVEVANLNSQANGVAQVVEAQGGSIHKLSPGYDLVMANMTAGTLLPMASGLRELMKPDGTLLVSGLQKQQEQLARVSFAPLEVLDQAVDDGWLALALAAVS